MRDYLKDKRVILVCPGSYLEGKGLGKWIDSFDVIVRPNTSLNITNVDDYGSRTDILYSYAWKNWKTVFPKKKQLKKIKYLVISHYKDRFLKKVINRSPNTIVINPETHKKIRRKLRTLPLTGVLSIIHLLENTELKSLNVVGMDFYKSNFTSGYISTPMNPSHCIESHIGYLELLRHRDKRLLLDDTLKDVIKSVLTVDFNIAIDINVSFLITYKSDNGGCRDRNLKYTINRIKKLMPNSEICLGENNDELFNKSKACNLAYKKATRDIFCIIDADSYFDAQLLEKMYLKTLESNHYTRIKGGVLCLDEESTRKIMNNDCYDVNIECYNETDWILPPNLISVIPRHQFEAINGFDEEFKGWGGEDYAFFKSLSVFFGEANKITGIAYHLNHPTNQKIIGDYYNGECENKSLREKYAEAKTKDDILKLRGKHENT